MVAAWIRYYLCQCGISIGAAKTVFNRQKSPVPPFGACRIEFPFICFLYNLYLNARFMSDKSIKERDEVITFSFLELKLFCRIPGSNDIAIITCVLALLIVMIKLRVK
jgi:hypothetical protein